MLGFFKRRGKNVASAKIGKEISQHIGRIATQIASGKRNEEETRRWVVDMVRSAFGYKDDEIETELKVLGQRVDVALLDDGDVIAVIECKAATVQLGPSVLNQAANYAAALNAEWAILTNGNRWMMFHVVSRKGREPSIHQLFDVEVLDDDGLSKDDISNLYLITKQAILSGETKMEFHQGNVMAGEYLKTAISQPDVLTLIASKLKATYKANHGVTIEVNQELLKDILEMAIDDFEKSV